MDNETIQDFLDQNDYDIRKSHNGRWIDQKCTMDVLCLVLDCILEYVRNNSKQTFTVNDVWHNSYTVENVQQIFSKPNPSERHLMNMISILVNQLSYLMRQELYMEKEKGKDMYIQLWTEIF